MCATTIECRPKHLVKRCLLFSDKKKFLGKNKKKRVPKWQNTKAKKLKLKNNNPPVPKQKRIKIHLFSTT
jgi:hypothetical protein